MNPLDEIRAVFRNEATDILKEVAAIVERLPELGAAERREATRTLMRHAHNVKGAAAVAGFDDVEAIAHALEGAMGPYAKTDVRPPEELLIVAEASVALAQRLVDGEHLPDVVRGMTQELAALQQAAAARAGGSPATKAEGQGPKPSAVDADVATLGGDAPTTVPLQGPSTAARRPAEAQPAAGSPQASIRVDTARLDRLMGFAGELLVAQSWQSTRSKAVKDFQARFARAVVGAGLIRDPQFSALLQELGSIVSHDRSALLAFVHLADEINMAMKRLRMLPLRDLAPVWGRVVADVAAKLGREVESTFALGDIELDRHLLDSLRDPLMHFLRNAVDHGIEPPEERIAAGKTRAGRVLVRSSMAGAMVRLDISDDGRGLDRLRIGEAAVARGLVSKEELDRLKDAEVLALIFVPGFSTAKKVSRISGRGVGLDVVRRRIEELGGSVEVSSQPVLSGTTFVLTLPVSLLSSKGLLVRAGESTYVLPAESIRVTRRVDPRHLEAMAGALVAEEGGRPLRLAWLEELTQPGKRRRQARRLSVVIVSRGNEQLGLVVDEVLKEEEFVIKRLPWNLRRVPGVNGAVVLADGSLAIAVDVSYLLERGNVTATGEEGKAAAVRVLVVEDSATARAELSRLLGEASYDVTTAVDGEEAWALLAEESFDLVIADVQMPRMDGLELTRRIRAGTRHEGLPIMLVTSLASPDDIAGGAAAGADEYLVKGKFRREELLAAVERLV